VVHGIGFQDITNSDYRTASDRFKPFHQWFGPCRIPGNDGNICIATEQGTCDFSNQYACGTCQHHGLAGEIVHPAQFLEVHFFSRSL
jgi:hypothetical protein